MPDAELPVPPARLPTEVVLIRPGLPPVGGADALAATVAAARTPWRFIGRLLGLPAMRSLARAVYRVVARNRYRMPGSTDACRIAG